MAVAKKIAKATTKHTTSELVFPNTEIIQQKKIEKQKFKFTEAGKVSLYKCFDRWSKDQDLYLEQSN